MKSIPSLASSPATVVIHCYKCLGKLKVPRGPEVAPGLCPFCQTMLTTHCGRGTLPVIPATQQVNPAGQLTVSQQGSTGSEQWSAKQFISDSSQQKPEAPSSEKRAITLDPRPIAKRARPLNDDVSRAQPFQQSGVVRLQSASSAT